jgi:hypothetical protein
MRIQSSSFSQFRVTERKRLKLYKVVRRVGINCALGALARRVDLVGSGDLEGPSVKEVKEALLWTRNQ